MKTYLHHSTQMIQPLDPTNSLTFPYIGSAGRSGVITAIIVEQWEVSAYKPKSVARIQGRLSPDGFTDIDNIRNYKLNRVLGWYIEDPVTLTDLANDLIKLRKE